MPNGDNDQKEKRRAERLEARNVSLRQELEGMGISAGALQLPVGTPIGKENIEIRKLIDFHKGG